MSSIWISGLCIIADIAKTPFLQGLLVIDVVQNADRYVRYTPAFALAVVAVVLFTISTLLHSYQVIRYRTWYFIPVAICGVMEVVGYIFRALSGKQNPYKVIYFVLQYFFIVVAPVIFSASIYTILSKFLRHTAVDAGNTSRAGSNADVPVDAGARKKYLPFGPRMILTTFILCDVLATIVQVAGAASIGAAQSNRRDPTTANNILLGGLAFQVFTFFIFLTLLVTFLYRARKITLSSSMRSFSIAWAIATLLVYLRTVFRLAETAEGLGGNLSSHEVYFGCLEFAPIVIAVFLFNIWHPGKWLPSYTSTASTVDA